MSLKYRDKPQVNYGDQRRGSVWDRFPQGAQPIATAPEHSSQPVVVIEANGHQSWALKHNNAWRKLSPFKDHRTGAVQWRMDGTLISNPVAWTLPKRG